MRPDALLFHDDFRLAPYWWDAAPPETARVAVLDAAEIGAGGSTRSGGMVSSGQKLALTNAIRGVSADRLGRLMRESMASFEYLKRLVAEESLDADLQITGRFFGAFTPRHFDR